MLSSEELELLFSTQKIINDNIIWKPSNENPRVQKFEVQVLTSEFDFFIFEGRYNPSVRELLSITLIYQKSFPLSRIDKSEHRNPKALGGELLTSWHKHKWDAIWEDKYAFDVTHEFQDDMRPMDFVFRFMEENNIELGAGYRYQQIFHDF